MLAIKKKNELIQTLSKDFNIIEGKITDLLTHETLENINHKIQPTAGTIAVGSAILGQLGTAVTSNMVASDEGIDVTVFAVEVTDNNNVKHYFKGVFPEVIFKIGDQIQVVTEEIEGEKGFAKANAVIDIQKNYIWTSQEVARGRLRYRLWGLKLIAWGLIFTYAFFFIIMFFLSADLSKIISHSATQIVFLFFSLLMGFVGWRVGASFDEQSIELEAILLKLGFNKPTMMSLYDFSVFKIRYKNTDDTREYGDRWAMYTYCLDLAKKADEEKYGKK